MVWLAGCATAPQAVVVTPVGPAPGAVSQATGNGSLIVYSAPQRADVDLNTVEWRWNNDYGKNAFLYEPAHTGYVIYAKTGEVYKRVANATSPNDATPSVVALPAGTYEVKAKGIDCASTRVSVLMPVVIKPGETTVAHLAGGWRPEANTPSSEVAKMPCGKPIGWRASEAGVASNP
jgi:hypothetical protein